MKKYDSHKKRSPYKTRVLGICCFLVVGLGISITSLYFTSNEFATELRQVRQPKANRFYIGIDISQTIRPDILADFKDALILRLKGFIGEKTVSYHVSIFGLPGCGRESIADIVSTQSPEDPASFGRRVEKRIRKISIARKTKGDEDSPPLATPFFCFLEKILTERIGQRAIIFSDLVNDDSGCQKHYSFPVEAITKFGINKESQIIFFYPTPYTTDRYYTPELHEKLIKNQVNFIIAMQKLSSKGKVRAFFYHIPDDPQKRLSFLRSHLQNSVPVTTFEIIWERVSKIINILIAAVRG
jgi:hypothetical protein